jgi:hypothetical protein
MASFDEGSDAALDIWFKELNTLWEGFDDNGTWTRVALVDCLMDSRGREKFIKCQGAGSHCGCNRCHFFGFTFAPSTVIYPCVRRHLPPDDALRTYVTRRGSAMQVTFNVYICLCPVISVCVQSYLCVFSYICVCPVISGCVQSHLCVSSHICDCPCIIYILIL